MKEITLSRHELYQELWSQPLSLVANKYMHSEQSLIMLCIKLSIPLPRKGHWEKIKAGKFIHTPPLSSNYQGPGSVTLFSRAVAKSSPPVSTESKAQKKVTPYSTTFPTLPLDKIVVSAGHSLRKKENINYDGMARTPQGELGICVSPGLIDRALGFMDKLIKALRTRGHDIRLNARETYVVIFQQELSIYCREKCNRVTSSKTWRTNELQPSGLLVLKLDGIYGREWIDGKTKSIEDLIPSMIGKFEEEARREIEWRANAEKSRSEREELEKIKKERELKHSSELNLTRLLLQRAMRWEKSLALRRFIDELEARIPFNQSAPEDITQYISWARKKADWYDPFINAEDEWLTDSDRESIEQFAQNKSPHQGYERLNSSEGASYIAGYNWFRD